MRWWIELIVSSIAYWVCAAIVVFILVLLHPDCVAGNTDAHAAACVRTWHDVVWTAISVFLVAYAGIVLWWTTKRGERRRD